MYMLWQTQTAFGIIFSLLLFCRKLLLNTLIIQELIRKTRRLNVSDREFGHLSWFFIWYWLGIGAIVLANLYLIVLNDLIIIGRLFIHNKLRQSMIIEIIRNLLIHLLFHTFKLIRFKRVVNLFRFFFFNFVNNWNRRILFLLNELLSSIFDQFVQYSASLEKIDVVQVEGVLALFDELGDLVCASDL